MKTKILLMMALIAIAVVSCQKDPADKPIVKQDVSFGIQHVDPLGLKDDTYDIECPEDLVPVKARIVIEGIALPFEPLVFFLNGNWYTQAIKLAPGNYTINQFYLLDANDVIIMATPAKGSLYEVYVEEGVAIDFEVLAFTKIEIPIDVLCYELPRFEEFGFFWFQVDRIVVWEKCFFGDLCVKDPDLYLGSWYVNQTTGLMIDMPAIFEIRAYKGSVAPENVLPYSPFTNANVESGWGVGAPVCVEWPDNIDVAGEEFIFELWIYVAVGEGFEFVLFHTWTFIDDAMVAWNGDQVIDFVLGNCGFGGNEPFLTLIPHLNLPETALVDVGVPATPGYCELFIHPYGFIGDLVTDLQVGWCADHFKDIDEGEYTMFIYSSLHPNTWVHNNVPLDMPFTPLQISQINWLFNNLHTFGFPSLTGYQVIPVGPNPLTKEQGDEIQDAIWCIIHGVTQVGGDWFIAGTSDLITPTTKAMYDQAIFQNGFIPLPGGWAAIIMVPGENLTKIIIPNPEEAQIILTVIDP